MPIIARDNRREFTPAPEGLHVAVCVDVVDLGMQTTPWGEKHKVEIWWQLEEVDQEAKPGPRRFLVRNLYTNSLNEKATLRHHLEAWRGRKFGPQELEGFDLENLIGVSCQLQIVHNLSDKGRTFANVQAVVPLGKGMAKIRAESYVRTKDRTDTGSAVADEVDDALPF